MEIRERVAGRVTILDVTGPMVLDEGEGDRLLRDRIVDLIAQGRRDIVLNLAGVSHVDTSGLAVLVAAHLAAARRGAQVRLAHSRRRLNELLALTRLDTLFEKFATVEDAIAGSGDARVQDS